MTLLLLLLLKYIILGSHNTCYLVNLDTNCSGILMFCHTIPCILTYFTPYKLGMHCLCHHIPINVVEVMPSQDVLEFNLGITYKIESADLVHTQFFTI